MFSRFNKKIETIFLDPSSSDFHTEKKVNIILSPTLYWVKRVKLPVKSLREAKALLPSLFEDILPEGNYSYTAYKDGEYFYIFAYQDKAIIDLLHQKGLQISQVNSVYFAQSEFLSLKHPLAINEEQSLYVQDGLVVVLPSSWVAKTQKIDLDTLKLSKNSIKLKQYGHIVNDKSLYKLIAIVAISIVVVSVQYFITNKRADDLENARYALFAKNSLQPTMLQNRSMLHSYEKIYKKQTKIREVLYGLLTTSLAGSQKIAKIRLRRDKLIAVFSGVKNGSEKKIATDLKRKGFDFRAIFKDEKLRIEVRL